MRPRTSTRSIWVSFSLFVVLAACAAEPTVTTPAVPASPVARPSSNVYFYPLKGQSAEQQDRDRYECYLWARRQTGYDPSQPRQDAGPPVEVVPVPPPGAGVAAGAATGAVIGAATSDPWHSGENAAIGAVAGAMIGAVADASRERQAERIEAQKNAERERAVAQADAVVIDYRNAMKACLTVRGYTVQ